MNDLYKILDGSTWQVHAGSTRLPIKNQRGKLYVNYKGKQINVKDIPEVNTTTMPVYFGYIFEGLHQSKPNAYYDHLLNTHAHLPDQHLLL